MEKDKVFTAALQQLEPVQKVYDAASTTLFVCLLACMRASVCVPCMSASVSRFLFLFFFFSAQKTLCVVRCVLAGGGRHLMRSAVRER